MVCWLHLCLEPLETDGGLGFSKEVGDIKIKYSVNIFDIFTVHEIYII